MTRPLSRESVVQIIQLDQEQRLSRIGFQKINVWKRERERKRCRRKRIRVVVFIPKRTTKGT